MKYRDPIFFSFIGIQSQCDPMRVYVWLFLIARDYFTAPVTVPLKMGWPKSMMKAFYSSETESLQFKSRLVRNVRLNDFFSDRLAMELCCGGSTVAIVSLYPKEGISEETARFIIRLVFETLSNCHEIGICHSDMRRDNLMLDNSGIKKITDFGHSRMFNPGWDIC